jgi:hypothetical protein
VDRLQEIIFPGEGENPLRGKVSQAQKKGGNRLEGSRRRAIPERLCTNLCHFADFAGSILTVGQAIFSWEGKESLAGLV